MSLPTGTRLGPYEILSLLGAGGMGEVYRARDARLGREVAVKVLGAAFAADADRLRRFEQEARTLAALNHPNLMAVYDFGSHEGAPYLVSELLVGETLQTRLQTGPVPPRKAAEWGRQIAAGLAAAHEHGIVHRDLKPANLFLTGDGRMKILDFGLAKAAQPEVGPDDATLAGSFAHAATTPGMALGTVGYMAPEQVRGEAADARADIFAFGVVLYEMLTGVRPFHRSTAADTMSAILRDEPAEPPAATPLPPALERIVRRCLEKQPQQRFQNASDLGFALEGLSASSHTGSQPALGVARAARPRLNPGAWRWLALAAVAALIAGGVAAWARWPHPFDLGKLQYTPFSFEPGGQASPVWSPDGKAVAYGAREALGDPQQVFVRYLANETGAPITHGEQSAMPFAWTPDGSRVLFETKQGIFSVSTTGGEPRRLLDTTQGPAKGFGVANGNDALALSPDGTALVGVWDGPDGKIGLGISSPPGSAPKPYPAGAFESANLLNPPQLSFAPNGRQLLLAQHSMDRGRDEYWLLPWPASAGRPQRVLTGLPPVSIQIQCAWLPDSHHIVLALPVPGSLATRLWEYDLAGGAPVALSTGESFLVHPAVSPDGNQLIYADQNPNFNVVSVALASGQVTPLLDTARVESAPAWAAKAPLLAYLGNRTGPIEVWLHSPDGPDRPFLTWRSFSHGDPSDLLINPYPSPDGSRVIFDRIGKSPAGGPSQYLLWMVATSGGAPVRLTDSSAGTLEVGGDWSPDGSQFVYLQSGHNAGNIAVVSTAGQSTPRVIASGSGDYVPVWSPSGEWIAYGKEDGTWNLVSPDGKQQRSLGKLDSTALAFSRDGRTLYGISGGAAHPQLFSLPLAGGTPHGIAKLPLEDAPVSLSSPGTHFSLTPDGQHMTYSVLDSTSNLWLVTGLKQH